MLKACWTGIQGVLSKIFLKWLSVGLIGWILGSLFGAIAVDWRLQEGEGVLLESCLALNTFLVCWASFHVRGQAVVMSSKLIEIGLMMGRQILFLCQTFLCLLGMQPCPDLFKKLISDGLFKGRPPDGVDGAESAHPDKRKNTHHRLRLTRAMNMLMCLPVVLAQGREVLGEDLQAFVGKVGLQTQQLPEKLKERLKSDLTQNPRELEGVPGLQISVADSGASAICMKSKDDILPGSHVELETPLCLGGIASGLAIKGKGKTSFEFITTKGKTMKITRDAFHVPDLPVNLVPPQKLMQTSQDGWFKMNGEKALLEFNGGHMVHVPFDPVTSLPMFYSFHDVDAAAENLEVALYSCVTEEANQNLSRAKKEMLRWHWRLGHPNMAFVKWLARRGLLGRHSDKVKAVPDDDHPMCASCNYGKQVRTPSRATVKRQRPDRTGVLKQERLEPGDCVAVDQFVVRQGGRLFTTSGREREEDRFKGGTIFVDMATGKMFVKFQVSLGTQETLLAKACFEKDAALHGVKIKNYHTDNGVFTARDFIAHVHESDQRITFSGVGAHHQNGIAERAIGTAVRKARTQLLHAQL